MEFYLDIKLIRLNRHLQALVQLQLFAPKVLPCMFLSIHVCLYICGTALHVYTYMLLDI